MIHLAMNLQVELESGPAIGQAIKWRNNILNNLRITSQKTRCSFGAYEKCLGYNSVSVYCEPGIYGGVIIEVFYGQIISVHVFFLGSLWNQESEFLNNLIRDFPELDNYSVKEANF